MANEPTILTVVTVRNTPGTAVQGNVSVGASQQGEYYLPGASYAETVKALEKAKFKLFDRVTYANE